MLKLVPEKLVPYNYLSQVVFSNSELKVVVETKRLTELDFHPTFVKKEIVSKFPYERKQMRKKRNRKSKGERTEHKTIKKYTQNKETRIKEKKRKILRPS
jgi:hypothetical protein